MSRSALSEGARLQGVVRHVTTLSVSERRQMLALLADHFLDVSAAQFDHDLAEKSWAILLEDAATGALRGFSTLMRLQVTVETRPVTAFFSGDTIVHRDYWGEAELARLWARHVFRLAAQEQGRVYWFLISSGYRTYRFLPVFFRTFYPRCTETTPDSLKRTLDALGQAKFGDQYDPVHGIVRPHHPTPLRTDLAEVPERRRADPHVAFFVELNPGYARGDELACLTELVPENLTPAGRRMLGGSDTVPDRTANRAEEDASHHAAARLTPPP